MAHELDITAAAYRKIETGETKLSVERLMKIADILETPFTDFFDVEKNIFNQQNNHDNENVYQQKIDNFYQENKEVYQELLKSKDDQIAMLKEQLAFFKEKK